MLSIRVLKRWGTVFGLLICFQAFAAPRFVSSVPDLSKARFEINGLALCVTAKQTLAYLNKGADYDKEVIHVGKVAPISLSRVKATLQFICKNQSRLNDPAFIKKHFEFIRWYPDIEHARKFSTNKPLLKNLPKDRILMTKYYVHMANASLHAQGNKRYALYALPKDEQYLTQEQANATPTLTRLHFGKQAILAGALDKKGVRVLAYVSRDDLESALMQGTIVADFGARLGLKIFNVHRNNNIEYDKIKPPYEQERYWYFKQVDGIKGYGKDSDDKITVNSGVTFAADLTQFGLGKLLMVQYPDKSGAMVTFAGILADTGGAFTDNLYQIDYLAGTYRGKRAYAAASRHLPNYVHAYFMVLKPKRG